MDKEYKGDRRLSRTIRNKRISRYFYGIFFAGAFGTNAAALPVDLELSLVIDSSSSISADEFALQMLGYANAFRNTAVSQAIEEADGVAVDVVFFSSSAVEEIGFTLLDSIADAESFAAQLESVSRPLFGGTNISTGIELAADALQNNDFEGARVVIDVSGDGTSNSSITEDARDAALASGVDVLNGLAIGGPSIEVFYEDHVIGGDGAFLLGADSFEDFEDAILAKLEAEIIDCDPASDPGCGTPGPEPVGEPTTLLTAGLGLFMLAGLGRSRRRNSDA